ncbi:Hpt domain-containing protein [Desulfatitalea alkaliphila]|uniref:Hpt domain-containing protein n=1 Tax=Desulfatitalea alkaliphila TaxID=2929485 RepID=A0AA41R4I3_9BACT|nr:Hpt domain-containing protein [Desulfatitalea alkaliphila]MCJ8500920.1 Hpt domain-containing protein [Desulfatitalea alkaliphila]
MNIKALADGLGLEEDEFLELLALFNETGQADMDRLQAALADGDAQEVMRRAHTLKGASGNLGLTDISALSHVIEQHADKDQFAAAQRVFEDLKRLFATLLPHS